jgi:hypothetical protein
MVVEDAVGGRRWTRSDGFAQVFLAVPWGWPLAAALRLPGLRILAGRGYDLVAHNRARLSAALGLAACGVPAGPAPAPRPAAGRPLRHRVADGVAPALREGAALILGLACVSQLLIQNPGVPRALRRAPPSVLGSVIEYPRLHQGWGMFAPEAPVRDHMLVVDAVTVDGRHVDPFNALASRTGPVPVDEIPERLGQDQFFCDYVARIANAPAYHGALRDWIERYPERTGQAADRLFSYEVYLVEDQSPPPGETVSRGGRRRWLFGRASS